MATLPIVSSVPHQRRSAFDYPDLHRVFAPPARVDELVDDLAEAAAAMLGERSVIVELDEGVRSMPIDGELLSAALGSMERPGATWMAIRARGLDIDHDVAVRFGLAAGRHVQMSIASDGGELNDEDHAMLALLRGALRARGGDLEIEGDRVTVLVPEDA